jgi:hypothetical protein
VKRLNYERVRISTIGGVIECISSMGGWKVSYEPHADQPWTCSSKSIEEAGQQLVNELKRTIEAIEVDLNSFVERNR